MEYLLYWVFFEFIGCSIARLAIPTLSFGAALCPSTNAPAGRFNWLGWRRDEDGRMVVACEVAGFIGFMIMVIILLLVVFAVRPF